MSKLLGKSSKGNMLKIEDLTNPKGYEWYFLGEKVIAFAKSIPDGSEVEFKSEERNGENTISFIKRVGVSGPEEAKSTSISSSTGKTYGKSPQEQDSIKKQAMLKAAADAVATAMQGQVDVKALGEQICSLYDVLLAKINS